MWEKAQQLLLVRANRGGWRSDVLGIVAGFWGLDVVGGRRGARHRSWKPACGLERTCRPRRPWGRTADHRRLTDPVMVESVSSSGDRSRNSSHSRDGLRAVARRRPSGLVSCRRSCQFSGPPRRAARPTSPPSSDKVRTPTTAVGRGRRRDSRCGRAASCGRAGGAGTEAKRDRYSDPSQGLENPPSFDRATKTWPKE